MPGSIAKNAQEGTRSEYLAQYILSTFGTCIPVPHPEDSGIDLYCTLGYRIGRKYHVDNHYLVQVKSNNEPIKYKDNKEVEWLLSHKSPFFICVINKKEGVLQLYQTAPLAMLYAKKEIPSISLHPEENNKEDYFPTTFNKGHLDIYLGKPIIKILVANFEEIKTKEQISKVIKSWIILDQENIALKTTGFTLFRTPDKWTTNISVQATKFIGNFKDNYESPKEMKKYNDLLFKLLAQLVNQAVSDKNINLFNSIITLVNSYYPRGSTLKDGYGIGILGFSIAMGEKELGLLNNTVKIRKPN